MKKHILSNYLKQVKKIVSNSVDDSVLTETIETSDPDEFRCHSIFEANGPDNTLTHTIETSDPDEFHIDNTTETRSIETSDPDEFYDTTETTFTLETCALFLLTFCFQPAPVIFFKYTTKSNTSFSLFKTKHS